MAFTDIYGFEIKNIISDYLYPDGDWNLVTAIVNNNLGNIIKGVYGDNVISGLGATAGTTTITYAAGTGFSSGCYFRATSTTVYTVPGGTTAGTYKTYATISDKRNATFTVAHAASVPTGSTPLYEFDWSGTAITAIRDIRTYIPTPANHDHTGGLQGPQLKNASIDPTAAIDYSKLNLIGLVRNADIKSDAAIAYSKLSLAGSILNTDINTGANIAYSKLDLADSIVNADIKTNAAIAYTKLNLINTIVNADISAIAAIDYSKLDLVGSIQYTDLDEGAAKCRLLRDETIIREDVVDFDIQGDAWGVTIEDVASKGRVTLILDTSTVTGSESITLAPGATAIVIVTHADGDWMHPPTPVCVWTGSTVEAYLDLGNAFSNTQFSLQITNTGLYSSSITLNYTRKGLRAN